MAATIFHQPSHIYTLYSKYTSCLKFIELYFSIHFFAPVPNVWMTVNHTTKPTNPFKIHWTIFFHVYIFSQSIRNVWMAVNHTTKPTDNKRLVIFNISTSIRVKIILHKRQVHITNSAPVRARSTPIYAGSNPWAAPLGYQTSAHRGTPQRNPST